MLMNDGDPVALRVADAVQHDFRTITVNCAGVLLVDSREDFDQRALAGAVLARERMDFAGVEAEVDPAQHFDGAEALSDATKLNC